MSYVLSRDMGGMVEQAEKCVGEEGHALPVTALIGLLTALLEYLDRLYWKEWRVIQTSQLLYNLISIYAQIIVYHMW